jgi:hypothetical protein
MGVRSAKNACLDDGLPPTLSAVQPTQVSSLGGQTVRITGTYLGNATGVELGGLLLPLHVWQAVDDRNLDLEMPEARNLGPSSLRVRNSLGWSNSLSIQYVRAQPPEMRTSRDWLAGASLPLQYRFAAAPHGIWVALLALSPDTTPVLGGQLLSHAIPIQAGLLDARGLGLLYVVDPRRAARPDPARPDRRLRRQSKLGRAQQPDPDPLLVAPWVRLLVEWLCSGAAGPLPARHTRNPVRAHNPRRLGPSSPSSMREPPLLNRPLKKSREAQSCGFGVPLASRTAGESTDSSRIRDADGASKTLL